MKTKFLILNAFALTAGLVFSGCSDDNDDLNVDQVPVGVRETMSQMFPGVYAPEWEQIYPYYVADFMNTGFDTEAWFSADGAWAMTETDYNSNISYLPAAVQQAFADSQYSQWIVDDVDTYQRTFDSFCVIEVESGISPDVSLFYSYDGILLNEVANFDINITPNTIVAAL
ncbi:MAG: PepSY-like domain-containing protein [Lachnospiraceae bacterium]|nr:PepSY-like domain-containing protein [Lachnospiraceae bacterium]